MTPIRKRMIEAAKPFFSAREINGQIRRWLRGNHHSSDCPWNYTVGRCNICAAMFPKVKKTGCTCPCGAFGKKYVIKRAKEALK